MNLHHLKEIQQEFLDSESNLPEQTPTTDEGSVSEKNFNLRSIMTTQKRLRPVCFHLDPLKVFLYQLSLILLMLEEIANTFSGASSVEDLKTQIQESVRPIIGFNKDRGDQAKISFIPFAPISKPEGSDSTEVMAAVNNFLPYIIMLVAILLFFFVLVRPLVTSITTAIGSEEDPYAGLSEEEKQLLEVSTPDGNNAMTNRIRRMIEGFEPIDARDLNKLVDMNEEPSAKYYDVGYVYPKVCISFNRYKERYNLKSI